MEAQRQAITAECARRGWQLVDVLEDVASGESFDGRPGLDAAMARIRDGEAMANMTAVFAQLEDGLIQPT